MNLTIKNPEFSKEYKINIFIKENINGEKLSQPMEIIVKIKNMKDQEKQFNIRANDLCDELYKKLINNDELRKINIFNKDNIKKKLIEEKLN